MMRFCVLCTILLLHIGCTPQRDKQQPNVATAPVISYHQHLMSAAAAQLWSQPPLGAIEIPEAVNRLLSVREQGFGDKATLASLYTDDALLLDPDAPEWIRGRSKIAEYYVQEFRRNYRVTPVAYKADGSTAELGAYLTRDEDGSPRHFAHALLLLKRTSQGAWRISAESLVFAAPYELAPFTAANLIEQLDAAGIRRAVVLSVGYLYGDPRRNLQDEYAKVREENNWTAQQANAYPDRLIAFCGISPLTSYAIAEMNRCATELGSPGLKLHMGNSGVDFRNPEHVKLVREFFTAANQRRLPIVVHLRTRNPAYGRIDAEIFLNEILPSAPDIVVQIAHLAGAGPGYPAHADEAMAVFADAVKAGDRRVRNLYFDVTTNVTAETSAENAELIVSRLRQVGMDRVFFGADLALALPGGNPRPREAWAAFRAMLPLTDEEFGIIAANVAPYLR